MYPLSQSADLSATLLRRIAANAKSGFSFLPGVPDSRQPEISLTTITQHIEYLLQRHDCVILPGIGAIVAEHVAARIDFEAGIAVPPATILSLNRDISHDDGMLATSIARAEQIKFEEARGIMRREIAEIKATLMRDGEYSLGSIGHLSYGPEDRLEFIPRRSPQEMCSDMGMPVVDFLGEGQAASESATASLAEVTSETLAPHQYTKILSDRNYYIAINKIFARCAASVIVIMALTLPFIMPQSGSRTDIVNASLNPVETLSSRQASATRLESAVEATDIPEDAIPDTNETVGATQEFGHYLIVATFHTEREASDFIASRSGSIFPLQTVERNGVWRVSAGHGDQGTLRALLNSSEFRAAFSEAWIWDSAK